MNKKTGLVQHYYHKWHWIAINTTIFCYMCTPASHPRLWNVEKIRKKEDCWVQQTQLWAAQASLRTNWCGCSVNRLRQKEDDLGNYSFDTLHGGMRRSGATAKFRLTFPLEPKTWQLKIWLLSTHSLNVTALALFLLCVLQVGVSVISTQAQCSVWKKPRTVRNTHEAACICNAWYSEAMLIGMLLLHQSREQRET